MDKGACAWKPTLQNHSYMTFFGLRSLLFRLSEGESVNLRFSLNIVD